MYSYNSSGLPHTGHGCSVVGRGNAGGYRPYFDTALANFGVALLANFAMVGDQNPPLAAK